MGFDFGIFEGGLDEQFVGWMVDEMSGENVRRYSRLWNYYQNSMQPAAGSAVSKLNEACKGYIQAQEIGLPGRVTGINRTSRADISTGTPLRDIERKEIVIENDITWRINAMVDFLFGKGINFISKAADPSRREQIEAIIKTVFEASGGVGFFQDMAVLGSVYGFVDCIIRPGENLLSGQAGFSSLPAQPDTSNAYQNHSFEKTLQKTRLISLELIEASRALPVLDENDYRRILYYVQHFKQYKNAVSTGGTFLSRIMGKQSGPGNRQSAEITEIIGPDSWQRYEDRELISEGANPLGFVPVVHIQNIAQPYHYEGLGDVEPLIPLQDELNTRLSDRASRITFQSFRMYLAKGIENINNRQVAPGTIWCTDNEQASIEPFGGDFTCPSENLHIDEIRQAIDKTSGVTPVVAGVLKDKLGNLTSAVAIRMTLMGMLAKTDRKQYTYGKGIRQIAGMVLACLDRLGIYRTRPEERDIDVIFPSPLPENIMEKLQEAKLKNELGVGTEQILKELGYGTLMKGNTDE